MNKIVILAVLMGVMACNQKNKTENANNVNKDKLKSSLKKMYYEDIYGKYPLNDTLIFSKEIVVLNRQCDSVSEADAERIAKSNHPTDKGDFVREGSRVSSLYEGVTDFKINEIKTIDKKTEVTVTLSNKHYPTQKEWNEKIIFIDDNGLKIENIYFNKNLLSTTKPSLKQSLIYHIKQFEEQSNKNCLDLK